MLLLSLWRKENFMKKIIAILICALLLVPTSVAADGAPMVSVSYNADEETVIISGSAAEGEVIIMVTTSGDTVQTSDQNPPFDILSAKCDGEFSEEIKLSAAAAGKRLLVSVTDKNGASDTKDFQNPDFASAGTLAESLNGAESAKAFAALLQGSTNEKSNTAILGFDTESEIFTQSSDEIFNILFAVKPSNADAKAYYKLFSASCALSLFAGADKEECEQILKENEIYFDIDYAKDYTADKRLSADAKAALCEILASEKFGNVLSSEETFPKYFEKAKALAAVQSAAVWQDIQRVMEDDFKDLFTLADITPAEAQNAYSAMMSDSFSCFADIVESYGEALSKKDESSPVKKPSMGGGGGGSATVPADMEIKIDEEEKDTEAEKAPMAVLSGGAESAFYDVPKEHWGYEAVSSLSAAGIISGYDASTFLPANPITRAEFTKLICTSFGIPALAENFDDVSDDAWYAQYVGGAAKYGIINGTSASTFSPDAFITREDAAVIAYRALKGEGIILNGGADFEDSMSISLYAITAVGAFKENGILSGDGVNFYPKNNITRAEAAQLLFKVLTLGK